MEELKKLIEENPEQKELIKKTISAYEDYQYHIHNEICGICFAELTPGEIASRSKNDFHATCMKHREYRTSFNASIVRRELNIPERTFEINFLQQL